MTTKRFTLALSLALAGCGNLVDPGTGASHVAYTPKGEVAAFTPQALVMLDGKLDKVSARLAYDDRARDEAAVQSDWQTLSADGAVAAGAVNLERDSFTSRLVVFRVPSGERLVAMDIGQLTSFQLSHDGSRLAIVAQPGGSWKDVGGGQQGFSGGDPVIQVFDTATGARLWQVMRGRSTKIAFSVSGDRLFAAWDEPGGVVVKAWRTADGEPLFSVTQTISHLQSLALTPDGQHLLGGVLLEPGLGRQAEGKWGLALWRTEDGRLDRTIAQPAGFANTLHLAISPDGRFWAAATMRSPAIPAIGTVQVWQSDGTLLHAFDKELFSLAFAPDGRSIATVDLDGGITIHAASDGQRLARRAFDRPLF
jgi:WD40 repeat protein